MPRHNFAFNGHWVVFGLSLFMFAAAFLFFYEARGSADVGRVAVPVAWAFNAIGLIGCSVAGTIRSLARRVQELERRLEQREQES